MSKIDDFIGFVSFNQPLPSLHSEKSYWLNDGEIIKFTNRKVTSSNNAEYEIYNQVIEHVRKCFNENRFEDIGDLLQKRQVYALTEI